MIEKNVKSESMLVRGNDLDQLLSLAGEVIIASSNQGIVTKNIQSLFDSRSVVTREVLEASKDLSSVTSLLSSNLHFLVQSIRTVDMKDIGFRARKLVRSIARKTGKQIEFILTGEETTVDKTIVEKLYDPVSHILRNAIDHGIEEIDQRREKSKPDHGCIRLNIFNTEIETFIEISDDGAGIEYEALRARGVEFDLITSDQEILEKDALDIICFPGFSTTENISELSGRGVGMDVVKTLIESIGGTLSFSTGKDKGTTFTCRVPLASAVNIIDALVVSAQNSVYAFPVTNIVASIAILEKDIVRPFQKGQMINYLGNLIPLYSLVNVLNRNNDEAPEVSKGGNEDAEKTIPVLIVGHKEKKIALVVTAFLAPQKLVIIPFDETVKVEGLTGTTVLGGKKLGLIVDIPSLIDLAENKDKPKRKRIAAGETELKKTGLRPKEIVPDEGNTDITEASDVIISEYEMELLSEVKQEFILELEKLLPELNSHIFELEEEPDNSESINAVFRLFHTIKGNLIMIGFLKAGETIHATESVLDNIRDGAIVLTPDVMDIIMDTVSYVEQVVANAKNENEDDFIVSDIIERSRAIIPETIVAQPVTTDIETTPVMMVSDAEYRLRRHRKKSANFFLLYIEFLLPEEPAFLTACLMYNKLSEIGDLLGSVPSLEEIENGLVENKVKFMFATASNQEMLEKHLKAYFEKFYGVTQFRLKSIMI